MNENENKNIDKESALNNKPKKYVLDMFPYPSGDGLHVGHPKGYIATDIYSRMYKMKGYDVVHPMGWDAFGLPAEHFALKNKTHPKIQTAKNIANFKLQLEKINLDYDWDREVSTTDPKFYKWTQWIFKQLYKKGLAYESNEPINWCPSCKTGLANEDLEGNACERCGTIVEKKPLRQWNLRITNYADRLIKDLDILKWPEGVKTAQKNWIGRSEGSEIDFKIVGDKEISFSNNDNSSLVGYGTNISMETRYSYEDTFKIFTTRADTLFGCTYCVLAPEHKLVKELLENKSNNNSLQNILQNKKEIQDYIELVKSKTDIERGAEGKEKTGVKLGGVMAINPANQKEVPIYIADYVLASYGTGAIMAVPAHDERDREFAEKYNIEILDVAAKHFELNGDDKEKLDVETLNRIVVDPIIRDKDNNFYLIKEPQNGAIHFAGGGVDEGETDIEAMKREIKEELGFTDLEVIKNIKPNISVWGYRHTKNKNQRTVGTTYEVVLNSLNRISSEIEEGKHELVVVKKEDVLKTITWEHHKFLFERYLSDEKVFSEKGILINSESFDGLTSDEAKIKITEYVGGKVVTRYKLRDWVFARQRYWGEPFPVVYATKINLETGELERDASAEPIMVADSELPVLLPEVESYEPTGTGESPLAIINNFINIYGYLNEEGEFISCNQSDEKAKLFKRETNTMPQWAGSSWYYLRFLDPHNENFLIAPEIEKEWQAKDANKNDKVQNDLGIDSGVKDKEINSSTVDVYVGGDHATRHLIYARFWHKFLYDIGVVTNIEPFARLEFLGFILAEDGSKMSKSKGNVINPNSIIDEYGSDTFRLYEMFMAPFEATAVWNTNSIRGVKRFVERVEKLKNKVEDNIKNNVENLPCANQNIIHQTVKKVGEDIENFKFNTCVSQLMIALNEFEEKGISKGELDKFLTVLFPFAPELCKDYKNYSWPSFDENKLQASTVKIALQINGKLRDTFEIPLDSDDEQVKLEITKLDSYKKYVTDAVSESGEKLEIKKLIIIKNKIVNIVI